MAAREGWACQGAEAVERGRAEGWWK